jgi:hypothetical protein
MSSDGSPVGVEVDLPCLTVGVGLDEVPLIVDVEAVFGDMVLEIGDEALEVDHCHWTPACHGFSWKRRSSPCRGRGRVIHCAGDR